MKPEHITAWALNEASAEERQQLEAALLENPQDKQKADETKAFCDFLLSELRDDSLALTDQQRKRLVEQTARSSRAGGTPALRPEGGTPGLRPPRKGETRWNMVALVRLAVAACAVLGGFWTWQMYSHRQTEAYDTVAAVPTEKAGIKVQLAQKPEMRKKAGEEARLLAAAPAKPVIVPQAPSAKPLAPATAPDLVAAATSALVLNRDQRAMTAADVERLKRVQDEKAYGLNFGGVMAGLPPATETQMSLAGGGVAASSSLGQMGMGGETQRMEAVAAGASLALTSRDATVGGGSAMVSHAPGMMTMNGGMAFMSMGANIVLPHEPESRMGRVTLFKNHWVSFEGILSEPWQYNRWQSLAPMASTADSVELVSLHAGATLAEYQPSVAFGSPSIYGPWFNSVGEAWLVLTAANASSGSIVVQAGAPLTAHAALQALHGLLPHFGTVPPLSSLWYNCYMSFPVSFSIPPSPLKPELNGNSPGLISFATAASVSFNATPERGGHLAEEVGVSGEGGMKAAAVNAPVKAAPGADVPATSGLNGFVPGLLDIAGGEIPNDPFKVRSSSAGAGHDFVPPSLSFGYSFIHNMGSLAGGGGFNRFSGGLGGYGMIDMQQLTLGANTPLGSGRLALSASDELSNGNVATVSGVDTNGTRTVVLGAPVALEITPQVVEFDGYVNYGSLILGSSAGSGKVSSSGPVSGVQPAAASKPVFTGALADAPKDTREIEKEGEALTLNGGGTVMLTGANTYTGATVLNGGTLRVTGGGALQVGAAPAAGAPAGPLVMNPEPAVRQGIKVAEQKSKEYFKAAYDSARANMLADTSESYEAKVPLLLQSGQVVLGNDMKTDDFYLGKNAMPEERKAERPQEPSAGESYMRIIENEMKEVAREPLSTLSIDVDTASYANVRRFLNQNMLPPPDAVRIEELINYFPTAEEGPAHEAKEPFAVRVELAPCPWQPVHRLARISIKGREMDKDRKASNLVFLVDVSGSMGEPLKLPLVQQSLRMLTEQLGEGDRVTMVVYAGSSGLVLPPTSGEKKAEILAAIDRLEAGGSTHGSAGIQLAYEQAVAGFIKGGVNRVILCTDGDFNVGVSSPEELEKLIKHKAKSGVFLSVLGFGSGNLKDRTMETLADKGNGNYAYIDSLSEARKVLVEQMSGTLDTIAKDVKIQVEFNPAAVRGYRLIGYENRVMAKEDFNDDTKDAGEIGAGHSVVALYEVVPANVPAGAEDRPAVDSLKYQAPAISPAQLAEAAKSGETMTVKLRYKEPDSDLSKLIEVPVKDEGKTLTASTEEFKFSAAVAGFGLLLRDSSYKGTLGWETVRRLALDGKGADKLGYRGEFLQLIDKARGLKGER